MVIKIPTLKCLRCGYLWAPRKADVVQCPRCKSARWNQKREGK